MRWPNWRIEKDPLLGALTAVALVGGLLASAMALSTSWAQTPRGLSGRASPPPTPTILPDEEWRMSWHETPQPYGGWVIGFNDEGDHIVIRECRYEDGSTTLVCTDWVQLQQTHWKWLKREVSKTMKW